MHYVLGDIHGMQESFDAILKQIDLQPEDTLFVIGDVIDRGAYGIPLLRRIMKMPNAKMLLGNHEYMMLQAIEHPSKETIGVWYHNGGSFTHENFKHLRKEYKYEILDFLHSLPLNLSVTVEGRDYLLVHGVPEDWYQPGSWYDNPAEYAVWERLKKGDWTESERTLIFGHTPTIYYQRSKPLSVWYSGNMIGIDCGAPYGEEGRLACLRLEDGKVFYSDTGMAHKNNL